MCPLHVTQTLPEGGVSSSATGRQYIHMYCMRHKYTLQVKLCVKDTLLIVCNVLVCFYTHNIIIVTHVIMYNYLLYFLAFFCDSTISAS